MSGSLLIPRGLIAADERGLDKEGFREGDRERTVCGRGVQMEPFHVFLFFNNILLVEIQYIAWHIKFNGSVFPFFSYLTNHNGEKNTKNKQGIPKNPNKPIHPGSLNF